MHVFYQQKTKCAGYVCLSSAKWTIPSLLQEENAIPTHTPTLPKIIPLNENQPHFSLATIIKLHTQPCLSNLSNHILISRPIIQSGAISSLSANSIRSCLTIIDEGCASVGLSWSRSFLGMMCLFH